MKKENQEEIAKRKFQEQSFNHDVEMARLKNDYVKNKNNGNYFLARCNMITNQLNENNIQEKIDGCTKTKEYFIAERALIKMQAIMSMRNAHFMKLDLIKKGMTSEEIIELEKDYSEGDILREVYDEQFNPRRTKAAFVNEDKPGN